MGILEFLLLCCRAKLFESFDTDGRNTITLGEFFAVVRNDCRLGKTRDDCWDLGRILP